MELQWTSPLTSDHLFLRIQNLQIIIHNFLLLCFWICLCLFWARGSLATFLVSWTWSRMVGRRLKPIQYTAQSSQIKSDFNGMRHTEAHWWLFSLLFVRLYLQKRIDIEAIWNEILMWLQGKWRQFMSSADRCKVPSHQKFGWVCF